MTCLRSKQISKESNPSRQGVTFPSQFDLHRITCISQLDAFPRAQILLRKVIITVKMIVLLNLETHPRIFAPKPLKKIMFRENKVPVRHCPDHQNKFCMLPCDFPCKQWVVINSIIKITSRYHYMFHPLPLKVLWFLYVGPTPSNSTRKHWPQK